jgi:hypothetical protein
LKKRNSNVLRVEADRYILGFRIIVEYAGDVGRYGKKNPPKGARRSKMKKRLIGVKVYFYADQKDLNEGWTPLCEDFFLEIQKRLGSLRNVIICRDLNRNNEVEIEKVVDLLSKWEFIGLVVNGFDEFKPFHHRFDLNDDEKEIVGSDHSKRESWKDHWERYFYT